MSTIQILSETVVAQIAAGEVVENPTSVLKELMENALDAGAAAIRISINGGGQRLIRISDDGSGILSDEVELAFTRHATSKLRAVEDLMRMATLGFRGEALASIASVSRVTITTRHHTEQAGTRLTLEGGKVTHRQAVGAPVGTVIEVENLFYNTPARLKFQKKDTAERKQISSLVTHYAIAYPQVRFLLEQDGREVFRSSGSGQLADVVVKVFGLDNFRRMIEVQGEHLGISVIGYSSAPDLFRSNRSRIALFINGRHIHDGNLTYAVTQAYHTLMPNGRYPLAVLMIEMPPDQVDVNVHPTKAEVRFSEPNTVFSAVQRAVREAVITQAQTPDLRGGRAGGFAGLGRVTSTDADEMRSADGGGWSAREPAANSHDFRAIRQSFLDLDVESAGRYATQIDPAERAENPQGRTLPIGGTGGYSAGVGAPHKPRTLPPLRVVGQVGAMYIVAEGPAGMYLIDQHAAHERILYEQFMENHANKQPVAQATLDAQTVDFPPTEARLIEEHLDLLASLGFVLEPFGTNTFLIRSIPAMLATQDPAQVIAEIIDDLELQKLPGQATVEAMLIKQVCKRAAVKAGQILSFEEMQSIIRQLERCETPLTCPHGRPTMLHISGDYLSREFGRSF